MTPTPPPSDPRSAAQRPAPPRRTVLSGFAGAAVLGLSGVSTTWAATAAAAAPSASSVPAAEPLPLVTPLPPGLPERALFAPAEQRLGALVRNIAPIANGISQEPATFGWLRGGWGGRSPDAPFNARIQENVLTLSWFLANRRAWNPYVDDPALLERLDAALGYYLGLQSPEGPWTEYSPSERSRAATAFGMSALSGTVRQLAAAGALPETRVRIRTALDRAAAWFLDPGNTDVYTTPRQQYTNQVTAGLVGVVEARAAGAAADSSSRLDERIRFLRDNGQSPAGFFYEPLGQDLGYSFEVMLPDLAKLWSVTGNADALQMADRFYDWLSWNMLREPDGSGYLTNVASCARTQLVYLDDVTDDQYKAVSNSLFYPTLAAAAAFTPTAADRAAQRAAWAASPDDVKPLSPYYTVPTLVRDLEYGESLPDAEAKQLAVDNLPYLRHQVLTEWRTDPLGGDSGRQWTYVRRPGVYVGAHFGSRASDLVRTGPAFVWTPEAGTVVQALNNRDDSAWCTILGDGSIDTRTDLAVTYYQGDPARRVEISDPRLLPGGSPLGMAWSAFAGGVSKELTVSAGAVSWRVRTRGGAVEQVPLVLRADDAVTFDDGTAVAYGGSVSTTATGLTISRQGHLISIGWDRPAWSTVAARTQQYFRQKSRRLHALTLEHGGVLRVTIRTR